MDFSAKSKTSWVRGVRDTSYVKPPKRFSNTKPPWCDQNRKPLWCDSLDFGVIWWVWPCAYCADMCWLKFSNGKNNGQLSTFWFCTQHFTSYPRIVFLWTLAPGSNGSNGEMVESSRSPVSKGSRRVSAKWSDFMHLKSIWYVSYCQLFKMVKLVLSTKPIDQC